MQEEFLHDDILFDRLVDGELSPAERRRLLASLDDWPDGWRRCALVFLEAQCLCDGLGELVRTPKANVSAEANTVSRAISTRENARRGVTWLAIAAGLLTTFTLGLMWREGAPIADNGLSRPRAQFAEVIPPPASDAPRATEAADALTLWVRDETGKSRPLRVPLVDAGTLDQQLGLEFQTGLPADLRRRLQERGFDVESKRRYAPLWLENGRPMILPVEDTRIVPVSSSVY
jgi:hypothetical protein